MYVGTVKSVRLDKGFGFIRCTELGDLFFHASELDPELPFDVTLHERRVVFDATSTPKGGRATSIRPADD